MSDPASAPLAPRQRLARQARTVLWLTVGVVLWGAVVRVTGSGAGCGRNWPLCNDEVVPRSPGLETLIEYSHRATSGLAFLAVAALAVAAFRVLPRGHLGRRLAVAAFVLMVGEAAIGAALVLFELVAENESIARALVMGAHLVNTFLLLGALTLLGEWTPAPPRRLGGSARRRGLVAAALGGTLLVGMSGAVSALGDTLYPATSHSGAVAASLSPTASVLLQLRLLHPLIAVAVGLLLLYLASELRAAESPAARREGRLLGLVVAGQLALGVLNVALLAPAPMQVLHLFVADVVWIVLVRAVAADLAVAA